MVAQGRALGEAGRARGVLDVDRVVGVEPGHPLGQPLGVDAGAAVHQLVPARLADEHDVGQRRALAADLLDHRAVVRALVRDGADQQPHAGLVDDVGQLVAAVGRVDVDQDRADLGRGVLQQGPLRAVRRPDADPVPSATPVREQPAGERVHVGVHLGVGPPPAGRRRRPAPRGRGTGPRCAPGCHRSCPRAAEPRTCLSCTTGALRSRVPPWCGRVCRPHPSQREVGRQGTGPAPITVGAVATLASRRSSPVRSLADDVRGRSDDQLRAPGPPAPGPGPAGAVRPHLARGAGRHPRERATRARRPRPRPPAGAGGASSSPATRSTSTGPRRCWGAPTRALARFVDTLWTAAVLWRGPDGLHVVRAVAEVLGPHPAGLGPSFADLRGSVPAATRPARRSTRWWTQAPPDAARHPRPARPGGRRSACSAPPGRPRRRAPGCSPHQLISPLSADHVVVPREVAPAAARRPAAPRASTSSRRRWS